MWSRRRDAQGHVMSGERCERMRRSERLIPCTGRPNLDLFHTGCGRSVQSRPYLAHCRKLAAQPLSPSYSTQSSGASCIFEFCLSTSESCCIWSKIVAEGPQNLCKASAQRVGPCTLRKPSLLQSSARSFQFQDHLFS